jgi:hypothetical protein
MTVAGELEGGVPARHVALGRIRERDVKRYLNRGDS